MRNDLESCITSFSYNSNSFPGIPFEFPGVVGFEDFSKSENISKDLQVIPLKKKNSNEYNEFFERKKEGVEW